ncbi:MAG: endonuclease/exonuclease/phosphatase family protein [Gammaproteobacteria bacterium]|nr:endonuclease/exonuclease/phosphatase family protein [Gammaproteobacteria bacterium]NNE05181.1 endonuclease/exonuclease/phosphatase family protein [Xanthomonadales bacterium]
MKTVLPVRALLVLQLFLVAPLAFGDSDKSLRIVSWNISGDSFVTRPNDFLAVLKFMQPQVLLLDEVSPSAGEAALLQVLIAVDPSDNRPWNIEFGLSGGRQRNVIASRLHVESVEEFSQVVPYPQPARQRIENRMDPGDNQASRYGMEGGIPVHGAIVHDGDRRLLVVSMDLQCCGGADDDWQEYRRRIEAREIRTLTDRALARTRADGLVLAGDFNAVGTPVPRLLLSGHYRIRNSHLRAVRIFHIDGVSDWTWDGRGTPFPSSDLDGQYYSRHSLHVTASYIFDSEDMDAQTLAEFGLQLITSSLLSNHRPLVVDYAWK